MRFLIIIFSLLQCLRISLDLHRYFFRLGTLCRKPRNLFLHHIKLNTILPGLGRKGNRYLHLYLHSSSKVKGKRRSAAVNCYSVSLCVKNMIGKTNSADPVSRAFCRPQKRTAVLYLHV